MRGSGQVSSKVVVKVGTRLLTRPDGTLDDSAVRRIAKEVAAARGRKRRLLLVSSGAVGAGIGLRGLSSRPRRLEDVQALAALGQGALIARYREAFGRLGVEAAQVLLTHDDLADRTREQNARRTLERLFRWDVLPIVNENDVVATDELRFGDNDALAAYCAALIEANLLVILTDVEGVLDEKGRRIPRIERLAAEHFRLASRARGTLSLGGMRSKLHAARLAGEAGVPTVIASGRRRGNLARALAGEEVGTRIEPAARRTPAGKRRLLRLARTQGCVTIDAGAVFALRERKASLLAAGVTGVTGAFEKGAPIEVVGPDGTRIARGIAGLASDEIRKILGATSAEAERRLGRAAPEVVHRDRLVLVWPEEEDL